MFLSYGLCPALTSSDFTGLGKRIANRDSVLISAPDGKIIYEKHSDKLLVPASTLKLTTALIALHALGPSFRFSTEFYIDDQSNLIVKGYGDPLLVSETMPLIALSLKEKIGSVNDLVLDDTYYSDPIAVPGTSSSFQPYDAPNGALCVNFNTVFFTKNKDGTWKSAEPQTPLLPYSLERIKKSGLKRGRIIFDDRDYQHTLYAGHLIRFFLDRNHIPVKGSIRRGKAEPKKNRLIYRYSSIFSLTEVIEKLMRFSNNFIANQLLIRCGTARYGPPGTMEKARIAANRIIQNRLKIKEIVLVEGSGISMQNRITATAMHKVLQAFQPYRKLLKKNGNEYYKTGTLSRVRSRAGYFETGEGIYRYVVMINTPGKSTNKIMRFIRNAIR